MQNKDVKMIRSRDLKRATSAAVGCKQRAKYAVSLWINTRILLQASIFSDVEKQKWWFDFLFVLKKRSHTGENTPSKFKNSMSAPLKRARPPAKPPPPPHTGRDSWHHRGQDAFALNTAARAPDGGGGWNSSERHLGVNQ